MCEPRRSKTRRIDPPRRLGTRDHFLEQLVNLVKLLLKFTGLHPEFSCPTHLLIQLFAYLSELVINECEHFGGAHLGSGGTGWPRKTNRAALTGRATLAL